MNAAARHFALPLTDSDRAALRRIAVQATMALRRFSNSRTNSLSAFAPRLSSPPRRQR
jgi:hypothetical protein